jgi:ABC-type bacteriocin/lantibiotic exporter with double-glycine peptidase domain
MDSEYQYPKAKTTPWLTYILIAILVCNIALGWAVYMFCNQKINNYFKKSNNGSDLQKSKTKHLQNIFWHLPG